MTAPEMTPSSSDPKAVAWFVAVQKNRTGPFTSDELKAKIAQGDLSPEQRVWRQGMSTWERSKDAPEVRALRETVHAEAKLVQDLIKAEVRSTPRWFVAMKKRPIGPFSDDQIEARIVEGQTQDASLVWRKGQAAWLPLASINELEGVCERAAAVRASNAPPGIPDDDDEPPVIPPTITVDDTIVRARAPNAYSAQRAVTWTPSTPVAVPAFRPERLAEAPTPADHVRGSTTPNATITRQVEISRADPAATPVKPMATTAEAARPNQPTTVDLLARCVTRLHPDNPRVDAAVASIRESLREGLKVGDPYILDAGLREMGSFIAVARERRLPAADSAAPEVALKHLHSVHAAAVRGSVALCNLHNLLAERTKNMLGVVQRPSWGVPVLRA